MCDSAGWEEVEPSLGLATLAQQAWRRAEARAVAHRLRAELDGGRRARDLVVLVRATTSLRLYEQALEEQGLPTYVVGGRGYWSQEQVRDGIAYLSVLANPLDETALYATLASPFCGVGADALVLLADAGRQDGSGAWAALQRPPATWPEAPEPVEVARLRAFAAFAAGERGRAERLPVEVLLERAIAGTGYDLAILARPGGDRRLANIRKLMRLAREYERAEGRDLRGFLAYAASQDLAEAREGEAALESEALDAVRLMTIHRAKGLEFPVVCVADLGRPGQTGRPRLLLGRDGAAGLKLVTTAGGDPVPALGYDAIAATRAAEEAAEERRLLYVAATRAEECLVLSGGTDLGRWPEARPGGPPLDWLAPALLGDAAAVLDGLASAAEDGAAAALGEPPSTLVPCGDGRVLVRLVTPATLPPAALAPAPRTRPSAPGTVLPAEPRVVPAGGRPRPAQRRLSYSALQDYGRCGYRFYLERVLRLPRVPPPPPVTAPQDEAAEAGIDPRVRGTLVHQLLERLDFARPVAPGAEEVLAAGAALGLALSAEEVADIAGLVGAFAGSPLCARLAAARHVRREAAFAFALEADGGGPLLSGFVDALAREPDGSVLVVDYKSDRLGDDEPATLADRDYGTQRQVYALAALRDGARAVEVAHCFLERPAAPAVARYTQDDAPALAVALLDLAGGVLAERWPVTARPHRELCGDCPGRSALCSWPESVTLRPYEDAGGGGACGPPLLGLGRDLGRKRRAVVAARQLGGAAQVDRRVQLRAEEHDHVGEPQPHEQDHGGGEGAVGGGVRREVGDVEEEDGGGDDPGQHAEHRARRDPLELPDLDVGRRVVDDRVDRHHRHHRRRPARDPPDRRGGVAQPDLPQHLGREAAAEEDQHEGDHHQHEHGERPREVVGLAPHEAAALVHPPDPVQRPPDRAERPRGAVQRQREADDERGERGPALRLGGVERLRDGVDGRRRRAGVAQVVAPPR